METCNNTVGGRCWVLEMLLFAYYYSTIFPSFCLLFTTKSLSFSGTGMDLKMYNSLLFCYINAYKCLRLWISFFVRLTCDEFMKSK